MGKVSTWIHCLLKTNSAKENIPILWHEADKHVTCTSMSRPTRSLKVPVMEELEELPVGNVCMEKQSQHLSHTYYKLHIKHRLSPVFIHICAGMRSHRGKVKAAVFWPHLRLLLGTETGTSRCWQQVQQLPGVTFNHHCGLSLWSFTHLPLHF